jgi:adenylosuccinate lyase
MDSIAELHPLKEFVHFGCTSEDVNNLAYGLCIRNAK